MVNTAEFNINIAALRMYAKAGVMRLGKIPFHGAGYVERASDKAGQYEFGRFQLQRRQSQKWSLRNGCRRRPIYLCSTSYARDRT
jgi:hypothetical protein